ncbi:MAG: hypothetical protein R3Y47_11775 [Lachnospiraceae bacterium]
MTGKDRARMAVYALGGVYLLMQVYEMYGALSTAGEYKTIMIVFMLLFTLVGIAMIYMGLRSTYLYAKQSSQPQLHDLEEIEEEKPEVEVKALEEIQK